MNRLRLQIRPQPIPPTLPPIPALLEPTKRRLLAHHKSRIDRHRPGLKPARHSHRPRDIAGIDRTAEAIGSIIRELDGFLLGLESLDGDDGPEDFVDVDFRFHVWVEEDCWLDESPFVALPLAADEDLHAGFLAFVEELHHAIELLLISQWAEENFRSGRVAHLIGGFLESDFEGLQELGRDSLLHQDARGGEADLSAVAQEAFAVVLHGVGDVAVVEEDAGRFAPEFERDVLQVGFCCGGHH